MQFDIVKRFGVQVVECAEVLPRPVFYDAKHRLAFVSAGLDDPARQDAADWLLSEALRSPALQS